MKFFKSWKFSNLKKCLPEAYEVVFTSGLAAVVVGISYIWAWPIACLTAGIIVMCAGAGAGVMFNLRKRDKM